MKVAVISGAARGIGRAIALKMAEEAYIVVNLVRSTEEISPLENEIREKDGTVLSIALDISSEEQVEKAISTVIKKFGRIDVLVNNAGFGIYKNAELLTGEEWTRLMDTNVKGTFLLSKTVIPYMKKTGRGHIIGIASDVSKRVIVGGGLYCASKYAQDAFLSALRKEVRKDNIKVSVIYPGLVDTNFHGREEGDPSQAEFLKPSDIAEVVVFITNAPPHVVIDELMIHPIIQEY